MNRIVSGTLLLAMLAVCTACPIAPIPPRSEFEDMGLEDQGVEQDLGREDLGGEPAYDVTCQLEIASPGVHVEVTSDVPGRLIEVMRTGDRIAITGQVNTPVRIDTRGDDADSAYMQWSTALTLALNCPDFRQGAMDAKLWNTSGVEIEAVESSDASYVWYRLHRERGVMAARLSGEPWQVLRASATHTSGLERLDIGPLGSLDPTSTELTLSPDGASLIAHDRARLVAVSGLDGSLGEPLVESLDVSNARIQWQGSSALLHGTNSQLYRVEHSRGRVASFDATSTALDFSAFDSGVFLISSRGDVVRYDVSDQERVRVPLGSPEQGIIASRDGTALLVFEKTPQCSAYTFKRAPFTQKCQMRLVASDTLDALEGPGGDPIEVQNVVAITHRSDGFLLLEEREGMLVLSRIVLGDSTDYAMLDRVELFSEQELQATQSTRLDAGFVLQRTSELVMIEAETEAVSRRQGSWLRERAVERRHVGEVEYMSGSSDIFAAERMLIDEQARVVGMSPGGPRLGASLDKGLSYRRAQPGEDMLDTIVVVAPGGQEGVLATTPSARPVLLPLGAPCAFISFDALTVGDEVRESRYSCAIEPL